MIIRFNNHNTFKSIKWFDNLFFLCLKKIDRVLGLHTDESHRYIFLFILIYCGVTVPKTQRNSARIPPEQQEFRQNSCRNSRRNSAGTAGIPPEFPFFDFTLF